ncbi:MAG: flagellar biosynthesis anti-sigma factor FlgM [Clostridium sp.]|uniref:flagellar biosynthesis anti-sigma factor FlgM n=1 Tax=Clostridium sp. TaxID=1506 RepID=UPI003031B595
MKINNGNIHALYVNSYKTNAKVENKNNSNLTKEPIKDICELSSVGKSLNKLAMEDEIIGVSSEAVEKIKSDILNGTYTVDSKILAKAMAGTFKK